MSADGEKSSRSGLLMIQVGVYLFVASAVAVGLWWLRADTIPAYQRRAEHAQLLALADRARGRQPVETYRVGEWVRVRGSAPPTLAAGRFGEFEASRASEDGSITAFSLSVQCEKAGRMEESSQVLVSLRAREAPRERSAN